MNDIEQWSIVIHILMCWKRDTSSEFSLSFVSQINVLEPHPFAPILATSGLDHDVKIWAPTSDEPSVLPNLKKVGLSFRFIHPIWCSINSWTNGCWSELIHWNMKHFYLFWQTAKKNRKEREEENLSDPSALHDMLDGPMMYYIMRQISRARRRVITPILSNSLHSLTVQTLSSFTVFYFYGEIEIQEETGLLG